MLLIDCDAGLRSLDRMTGTEENLVFDISDVVYGRCAPAEAIYPCADAEGLFLLPAPSSGENMIRPGVMRKLVPLLKRYYDYVLLDSPARSEERRVGKEGASMCRSRVSPFHY